MRYSSHNPRIRSGSRASKWPREKISTENAAEMSSGIWVRSSRNWITWRRVSGAGKRKSVSAS